MIIAVTASNNIYALNADDRRSDLVSAPISVRPSHQVYPCGNINPAGTTGTPVVDLASRSLFFDALINGSPIKHFIYSLNVDTGATMPGWPVDLNATVSYNGIPFISLAQEDRGALALVNGIVYVVLLRIRRATAAIIMAGLSAWTSTILPMCMAGRQQRLAAAFGDTAALPAMAQTCS